MKAASRDKRTRWCVTLALVLGWSALSYAQDFTVAPVVPMANEQVIRNHVITIVDVTGSIGWMSRYRYEKGLVQAFTGAMPDGVYESGIDSFAGMSSSAWLLRPFVGRPGLPTTFFREDAWGNAFVHLARTLSRALSAS